jgi:hypothetical protein
MKFIPLLLLALAVLVSCGRGGEAAEPGEAQNPANVNAVEPVEALNPANVNFVDERYELVSLIFRLAGRASHNGTDTDYQRGLNDRFDDLRNHPAVDYTRSRLPFAFDAVLRMAVHLERTEDGFALADNISFLIAEDGGIRWTRENAELFVNHLNDFYAESGFAEFFESHIPYYEAHTVRFIEEVYGGVNHEWFRQHGKNPDNMRVIITPGCSRNGYGASVFGDTPDDTVVYAAISVSSNYRTYHSFIIHEYVHSFANPIAEAWYAEDIVFRFWANASVDLRRWPSYTSGLIMAYEYVTRAYTILYMAESAGANPVHLLLHEKAIGFTRIAEVYAMITGEPVIDLTTDV